MRAVLTTHRCGDACYHAAGHICRCSCGGANHGRGRYIVGRDGTPQPATGLDLEIEHGGIPAAPLRYHPGPAIQPHRHHRTAREQTSFLADLFTAIHQEGVAHVPPPVLEGLGTSGY